MNTQLRQAKLEDLPHIMDLLNTAKQWLKKKQLQQWHDDYPSQKLIEEDIKNRNSFVVEVEGRIVLTLAVVPGKKLLFPRDSSNGCEFEELKQGIATRAAMEISVKNLGMGEIMVRSLQQISKMRNYYTIQAITHETNKRMQITLITNGYKYCGQVFASGTKMLIFQKIFHARIAQ